MKIVLLLVVIVAIVAGAVSWRSSQSGIDSKPPQVAPVVSEAVLELDWLDRPRKA